MNVIKFRAFDSEFGVMIYEFGEGCYVSMDDGELSVGRYDVSGDFYSLDLMQFTDLKDRHGKEIYEGDIVRFATKKSICKTPKCEEDLKYSISRFCPSCGIKVSEEDFVELRTVEFRKGGFAYHFKPDEHHYQSWPVYAAEMYIAWVEVVGNIYDNPELL